MNKLQEILKDQQRPSSIQEGLMQYWNTTMANVKVPKHRSINSLVLRSRNKTTGEEFNKSLGTIIAEAIMLEVPIDKLKSAIDNYKIVMSSNSYFYTTKFNLGEFIYKGLYLILSDFFR